VHYTIKQKIEEAPIPMRCNFDFPFPVLLLPWCQRIKVNQKSLQMRSRPKISKVKYFFHKKTIDSSNVPFHSFHIVMTHSGYNEKPWRRQRRVELVVFENKSLKSRFMLIPFLIEWRTC
jgi:hypothetical protein